MDKKLKDRTKKVLDNGFEYGHRPCSLPYASLTTLISNLIDHLEDGCFLFSDEGRNDGYKHPQRFCRKIPIFES